ncbi:hypothetical protein LCGC14_0630800 [marine sediment metagenome]|uniref:DNA-directed DNA polymerase family A palm domain-containing protein n=1 Tax=marine sediment metagenome TaxID=412755 RepID=A0A0F9UAK4_9ZZZZ
MKVISADTETHLIKPGMPAPKLVCWTEGDGSILLRDEAIERARELLSGDAILTGANFIGFDLVVLCAEDETLIPLVFKALDEGRIRCVQLRQMLIDNANGELKFVENELGEMKKQNFSLQNLVLRHLGKIIQKGEDTWRLHYNELDGVPLDEWPQDALDYAIGDSVDNLGVHDSQELIVAPEGIPGEIYQAKAHWFLALMSTWGVRTDRGGVEELKRLLKGDYAEQEIIAKEYGYMRAVGTRDMKKIKAAVVDSCERQSKRVKLTKTKQVCTERDVLINSDDDGLHAVSECVRIGKVLSTYVPALELGIEVPINCRYNPILETLRTSCGKPNLQNPPRAGGVRECFVARLGFVFMFCDYDTLEMLTLAQVCLDLFGYSYIADAARAGQDFHLAMAADTLEISYDEVLRRYKDGDPEIAGDNGVRQYCKIANYGFAGGMGPHAFVSYAKGYGIEVTFDHACKLHQGFRAKWREMHDYFRYCGALVGQENEAKHIEFVRSGMVRGQVRYTAICNGFFQHLAAMGAKEAGYEVARECYTGKTAAGEDSALYGCRPWLFAHDEIGAENPYTGQRASDAAYRLQAIMEEVMRKWCPDVPISASATMHRRWYKGGKPVIENGILLPSRPEKYMNVEGEEKTKWVHDDGN